MSSGGRSIIWEAHIHILVFTGCKNNQFIKKIDHAEDEYMNMCPGPIIDLPAPMNMLSKSMNYEKIRECVVCLVKSINARTITPGNKSPMFGVNQDGGNNYKC